MPSITLRIPEADYETLREMAKWKEVSLSDLIRQYSLAGVRQDAASTSVVEKIEQQIEEEKKRLERVRAFLEKTAAADTATSGDAADTARVEAEHSGGG